MAFELPDLPYAKDALEPHVSARTLEFHHGKHHKAYVDKLNGLLEGTPDAKKTLEDIILTSAGGVFNNAAQVWNHTFYWNCMSPQGGGAPDGDLAAAIEKSFGSFAEFKEEFSAAGANRFGSGWAWLVMEGSDLKVTSTLNADLPVKHGQIALLTMDVWEHAYYLDYQNARPKYIEAFVENLINWDFVAQQYRHAVNVTSKEEGFRTQPGFPGR